MTPDEAIRRLREARSDPADGIVMVHENMWNALVGVSGGSQAILLRSSDHERPTTVSLGGSRPRTGVRAYVYACTSWTNKIGFTSLATRANRATDCGLKVP